MSETIYSENFLIQVEYAEMEVNFLIFDSQGYCCRLVPNVNGFDLSPMDNALRNDPGEPFVSRLNVIITNHFL